MIRVAVVDDDNLMCEELEHYILEYEIKHEYDLKSDCFTECEQLLQIMEGQTKYDLIFLDIEFPGMNGIEFSSMVRNYLKNYKVEIVFISAKEQYAMNLFDVQPFNFLVKPISKDNVFKCLTKFLIYFQENNTFFEYTFENVKYRISTNEILFFESKGKKIMMYTHNNVIPFYGVFNDVAEQLKQQFVLIKRGLMVNLKYVINSSYTSVEMSNNMKFNISKSNRDYFRERLCSK